MNAALTLRTGTGITDAGVASDTSDAITKYLASDFASDYNNACQAAGLSLQVSSSSATATVGLSLTLAINPHLHHLTLTLTHQCSVYSAVIDYADVPKPNYNNLTLTQTYPTVTLTTLT